MPHYKDLTGKLHFLESEVFESMLPAGCEMISDEQALLEQQPSQDEVIKLQIAQLEAQQNPRRMREAALGIDGGWLANLNVQIEALRATLHSIPNE